MASISGMAAISTVKPCRGRSSLALHSRPHSASLPRRPPPPRSIAHEATSGLGPASFSPPRPALEKDPAQLWRRYVDWLYQNKELGLFLDVSRIGFTDEFVRAMEPRLQKAFADMEELEKGAIANPDEGRMVGHYWLRDPKRSPKPFLSSQIEKTLDALCAFAQDIISGKVWPLFLF